MANSKNSDSPLVQAFVAAKRQEQKRLRDFMLLSTEEKKAQTVKTITDTIAESIARYENKLVHLIANEVVVTDEHCAEQKWKRNRWRSEVTTATNSLAKWKEMQIQ